MFSSKIVAASQSRFGPKLMSYQITFPRYILAEVNTHKILNKSSSSSRAVKFEKFVKAVQETPFVPIRWQKEHPGMQGSAYYDDPADIQLLNKAWLDKRDKAIIQATEMHDELADKVTKQLCNRILEPWMYHTCLITGTEWQNFFALRAHQDAEIHFQKIAYMMLDDYNNCKPAVLFGNGKWHLPFGDNIDKEKLVEYMHSISPSSSLKDFMPVRLKICTARCARTSYTVIGEEGKPDNYAKDVERHDDLLVKGHVSPTEHPGKEMDEREWLQWSKSVIVPKEEMHEYSVNNPEHYYKVLGEVPGAGYHVQEFGWCANFRGFIQYRQMIPGQNRRDKRVIQIIN